MRKWVRGLRPPIHSRLSASALTAAIGEGAGKPVSPILVYRALDFLAGAGLIHRLAARNAYVPCDREHREDETTVFLVCAHCGGVDEVASREVGKGLEGSATAAGFRPLARTVEIEGECASCRAVGP
jgi:Fur family transcriptional regulator, zinc uptake regulator